MRLPDLSQLPDLPVRAVLGAVTDALAAHGSAVLVAPPGTGKTTLVPLALAAYNAGENNVVAWGGSNLRLDDIPFPETRGYVEDVLDKREEYARHYRHELGLN